MPNPKPIKQRKYCYMAPDFPKEAYAVIIFLMTDQGMKLTFPLYGLYTSIESINQSVREIEEDLLNKPEPGAQILERGVIVPLRLAEIYPLKPEFWSNPSKHYASEDRIRAFSNMLLSEHPYLMLVTPSRYDDKHKTWQFSTAMPMPLTFNDADLEQFMLTSDYPVESRANAAALYAIRKPQGIEWK